MTNVDPSPEFERLDDVVGCVFCGGASRRMGTDKALVELGGRTLLERALKAFKGVTTTRLLATGSQPRYRELGLPVVLDQRPDGGPLAGLEAALGWMADREALRDGWLLALACDMPRADPAVFRRLLLRARGEGADVCLLADDEDRVEPLFAVYHPRVLPAVRAALDAGERRMIAFHSGNGGSSGYGPVRVTTLPTALLPAEIDPACAHNLNTPSELAAERAAGLVRNGAGRDPGGELS